MAPLFTFKAYRIFIKNWLESDLQKRGVMSKMAQALACQNSHLTRLVREEVHLTFDQAFAACQFMKLSEIETQYFLKLVEYEKAGSLAYRKRLKIELEALVKHQENLSNRFNNHQLGNLEKEMTYYSSWYWSAIHILTDIPEFQTSEAISKRLNLPEVFVRDCLQKLATFDLVKQHQDGKWKVASTSIHLPKSSPMNAIQHQNWRSRAVIESQISDSNSIHYTIVQSIGAEDFEKIKQILLSTIDQYKKIADSSPAEEMICFTCDFFIA